MTEIETPLAPPSRTPGPVGIPDDADAGGHEFEYVIQSTPGWRAVDWREMYEYRELLFYLIWRDVAARYKQTILGGAWAILQPTITLVIFTLLARMVRIPMPMGLPAPVCIFAGLIPWTIFSQGMPAAANSMVGSLNMVTKVYFPRLFLPITAAAIFLVDGLLATLVYGGLLLFYQVPPAWTVVFLPLFMALTMVAALSMGILLAALTLFYRDFKHVIPFLVQIMMYVTPIFYTIEPTVPQRFRWLLSLNPMFGITDAFRSAMLGIPMQWDCFLISSGVAIGLFVFSLLYFRRNERLFADYV